MTIRFKSGQKIRRIRFGGSESADIKEFGKFLCIKYKFKQGLEHVITQIRYVRGRYNTVLSSIK